VRPSSRALLIDDPGCFRLPNRDTNCTFAATGIDSPVNADFN